MDKKPENDQFLITVYSTLRDEILKRIELEYNLMYLSLATFGILCAAGSQFQSPLIVSLDPPLNVFLALAWVNSDTSIFHIAQFIKNKIELVLGEEDTSWEHYFESKKRHALSTLSVLGAFAGTSILATILATWLELSPTIDVVTKTFLSVLAGVIFSIIAIILIWRYSYNRQNNTKLPFQRAEKDRS